MVGGGGSALPVRCTISLIATDVCVEEGSIRSLTNGVLDGLRNAFLSAPDWVACSCDYNAGASTKYFTSQPPSSMLMKRNCSKMARGRQHGNVGAHFIRGSTSVHCTEWKTAAAYSDYSIITLAGFVPQWKKQHAPLLPTSSRFGPHRGRHRTRQPSLARALPSKPRPVPSDCYCPRRPLRTWSPFGFGRQARQASTRFRGFGRAGFTNGSRLSSLWASTSSAWYLVWPTASSTSLSTVASSPIVHARNRT